MTTSNSPLILPLSSTAARGWKKPERIIEEIKPSKTRNDEQQQQQQEKSDVATSSSSSSCQVCRQHEARYTCPRCQLQYCGVECYRSHTSNSNGTANSCTEEFFKQKVTALMKLESIEAQGEHHQMLQRYHQQQNGGDDDFAADAWEQEELYQLLSKLEDMGDDNDLESMPPNQIAALVPPSLRRKFQRDLQSGNIQQLILKPWFPWWRRQLVGEEIDESQTEENGEETTESPPSKKEKSLDERLLKVRKFQAISKSNQKVLLFNVLDILYAICSTLRLYHGVQNATTNAPIEAAASLLSASTVLSKDARYTSLAEVLSQCTTKQHQQQQSVGVRKETGDGVTASSITHWSVLVEDVSLLVPSHRLVGRGLLEACDMFKAAIKELKRDSPGSSGAKLADKDSETHDNTEERKEHIERMRRLRKKLEFFLSWSPHPENKTLFSEDGHLNGEIIAWRDDWKSLGEDQQGIESDLDVKSLGLSLPP